MGDGVICASDDGEFTLWNTAAERLLGMVVNKVSPEQWAPTYGLYQPDGVSLFAPHSLPLARAMRGESCDGIEVLVRRPLNCENRWLTMSGRPLKDVAGALQGGVVVLHDVTARKKFEQALQEKNVELENANRAKDLFLASMSHELRTPLNAIIGFTGTLLMKLPGPLTEQQSKQLQTVQSSAKHLLSLIEDLLDLAKIEAGKVTRILEPVSLQSIV